MTETMYAVHRNTGTVHVARVEEDRSVVKTLCGRPLTDRWMPGLRFEDVTCASCDFRRQRNVSDEPTTVLRESQSGWGEARDPRDEAPLPTFYTRDSEGDRAFEEGVAFALEQVSGRGEDHAKGVPRSGESEHGSDSWTPAHDHHFSPRPEAFNPDDAIGYALLETEHIPGFARRGPAFREKLAEAGWEIRKVPA